VARFFKFCNLPITDHTVSDLIRIKQADPNNCEIEKALRKFITTDHPHSRRRDASIICGIFARGNFTPLRIHVNTHYVAEKTEVPEPIVKAIFRDSTPEQQTLQEWQAYLGERINACGLVTREAIHLDLDPDYAVVFFDGFKIWTKNHIRHFSICPHRVARSVLEIMQKTRRNTAFPNWQSVWKKLTKYAKETYNVRYHSHYLRSRFETIADDTGISMNKVNFFMGGSPHGSDDTARLGHLPWIYLARQAPKYIRHYKQFLADPLSLT
jgi:hypothetical protein